MVIFNTVQAIRQVRRSKDQAVLFEKTLPAGLVYIVLTIYTVINIGAVLIVYWLFLGFSVAYQRMVLSQPVGEDKAGRRG